MQWVIAYDIDNDQVRDRVAHILLRHGRRVQKSVFECRLDDDEIRILSNVLGALIAPSHGGIRFYRLCRTCQPEAFGIGETQPAAGDASWIIGGPGE